jgi:predicted RNA-binding Zn-ribbon protein involved in translation (DUF1610 family)
MSDAVEWIFEGPDPEVGIFGDLIVHPCAKNVDEEQAEEVGTVHADKVHTVRIITRFRCPACGAETTATEEQPREHFLEPGRGGW